MATYQISFFKTLLNSSGHPFRCLQECVEIDNAKTPAQAAARAARTFEARHHVPLWSQWADAIDISEIPASPGRARQMPVRRPARPGHP